MKKILLIIICLFTLTVGYSQVISLGKNQFNVTWDLLDCNSKTLTHITYTECVVGDTVIMNVNTIINDTIIYNPIYCFVNDVCVFQRITYFKEVNKSVYVIIDVKDYKLSELGEFNQPLISEIDKP